MFKNEEEKIDAVMHKLMKRNNRLSEGMHQNSIEMVWEEVLGKTIAKYTRKINLFRGVLTVYISSAALRNELIYEKENLRNKLNAKMNYKEIKEVLIK